jgi:acetyl-CoA C-acetyltransferase
VIIDPRTPVLVGVAQHTVRPPGPAPEPLESWEQVARAAVQDSGAARLLDRLDSVQVVYCQSWPYDAPVDRLVDRLGISPAHRHYSGIGGTTPQQLVNASAERILDGTSQAALIVGAEALSTLRQLKKAGERAAWSHRDPEKKPFPYEAVPHKAELAHQVFQAWETFPLFDTARRAARGESLDGYATAIGELLAPMTRVAAGNQHAWFPLQRSASELSTPTPANRVVGWPYTKYEVSVMDVDMAAAVVLVSSGLADELGIAEDRRTYLTGWAYATDVWTVAERDDLAESPAMRAVFQAALRMAGNPEVTAMDLYSCFASSLHLACDALGIDPLDPRGLTVTGGLPFAGGPASNYMLHSIATMAETVRAQGGTGLVSGVGMHMTKHVAALWSATPPASLPVPVQVTADLGRVREVHVTAEGPATVVAYTSAHGRDGAPESVLVVAELADGSRCYARTTEADLMADALSRELVGAKVSLVTDGRTTGVTWS